MSGSIRERRGRGRPPSTARALARGAAICFLPVLALVLTACAAKEQAGGKLYSRLEGLAPDGFSAAGPSRMFGTVERGLKDGTIFDYMDGGGVAYLELGFLELFHAEYDNGAGLKISFDMFLMKSPSAARAAIADERICPAGGLPLDFASPGRAFRFPPDYFMYFVSNDRLVYLHINDDLESGTLDRFARKIKLVVDKEGT